MREKKKLIILAIRFHRNYMEGVHMKKSRLLSAIVIMATVVGLTSSVSAERISTTADTVRVGNYDCLEKNGQYFTEINGELYMVINLDELEWKQEGISRASSVGWLNGQEVDISDGDKYNGTVNMKNGDYSTPIFIGYDPDTVTSSKLSYNISASLASSNSYTVDVHVYEYLSRRWNTSTVTINFGLFTQRKVLFTGQSNVAPTKMCLTFDKDNSTGKETFDYSFYVVAS